MGTSDLQHWDQRIASDPRNPQLYVRRGMVYFKQANIHASIQDFDRAESLDSRLTPYLWQRGLSYYYADRHEEGAKQFEIDLTVNAQDVEETVWRYLCMAQVQNTEMARRSLLPVRQDPRPVMRSVYELYAGQLTPEQVLQAGLQLGAVGKFYSQLYVGLYYEAARDLESARRYICEAVQTVQTEYQRDDYMGHLALVHQRLRSWDKANL